MTARRRSRRSPSALTAETGADILEDLEETGTSDEATRAEGTGDDAVVGHTVVDLLYEKPVKNALAKFISDADVVEILGAIVYVALSIWGKSDGLPMPFWLFAVSLVAYHLVARPFLAWVLPKRPLPARGDTSRHKQGPAES